MLIALYAISVSANAIVPEFSVDFSKESYERGEKLVVELSTQEELSLSAFKVEIKYDVDDLEFLEASASGDVFFDEHDTSGKTLAVYALKEDEIISGNICEFYYEIDEDLISNSINIEIIVSDMVTQDSQQIDVKFVEHATATIIPRDSEDAKILSLVPSSGSLSPSFNADTLYYSIAVPYSVNEMEFDIEVSSHAKYSINRKNLGSGGSTTTFKIVVTAQDDVTKSEYLIDVSRGEYNPSNPDDNQTEDGSSSMEMPVILSLAPSVGQFNEEFSPDIYEYTMQVPYEVSSMSFTYLVDNDVDVSINRKNLGSGGSTEDFIITARLDDEKVQYTVLVTRGEYVRGSSSSTKGDDGENKDDDDSAIKEGKTDDVTVENAEGTQGALENREDIEAGSAQLVLNNSDDGDIILIIVVICTGLVVIISMVLLQISNRNLILRYKKTKQDNTK